MPEDPELVLQEPDGRCIKEGVTWSMWRALSCGVCDEGSRGNVLKTNEDWGRGVGGNITTPEGEGWLGLREDVTRT